MSDMSYSELLKDFYDECDKIAADCAAEGYPSRGSNYDLRVEELKKDYPDLFWDGECDIIQGPKGGLL